MIIQNKKENDAFRIMPPHLHRVFLNLNYLLIYSTFLFLASFQSFFKGKIVIIIIKGRLLRKFKIINILLYLVSYNKDIC